MSLRGHLQSLTSSAEVGTPLTWKETAGTLPLRAGIRPWAWSPGGSDPVAYRAGPKRSALQASAVPALSPKPDCTLPGPETWDTTTPTSTGQRMLRGPQWPVPRFGPREGRPVCIGGREGPGDTARVTFLFHLRNTRHSSL